MSQPANASLLVSTLSTGNYVANAFAGFTSPATTISNGVLATGVHSILDQANSQQPLLTSNSQWQDMEVTTWLSRGTIYLRLANGTGLFFQTNTGANSGAGEVQIGIVQNFVAGSGNDHAGTGNFFSYYINNNPAGTLAGYSGTYTAGNTITFGVQGFNVYLKINGTTVFSYTEWRAWQVGAAMIGGIVFGIADTSVNFFTASLFSNPGSSLFDTRDFGMRSLAACTGSMNASSNTLTLNSNPGFQVGDQIIVEIGGESRTGTVTGAFTGRTSIRCPFSSTVFGGPPLSFSVWFNTAVSGSILSSSNDVTHPGLASSYDNFLYVGTGGKLQGGWYDGAVKTVISTASVNDGVWHHAVVTFAANSVVQLYLDGSSQGTTALGTPETGNNIFWAGDGQGSGWPNLNSGDNYFSGGLRDVRAYNRVISSTEVTTLFNAGLAGGNIVTNGLVLEWLLSS